MSDDEAPTPADLAASIAGADRPSKPAPAGMRFQWDVPRGVTPTVSLGFALLVVACLLLVLVNGLLQR